MRRIKQTFRYAFVLMGLLLVLPAPTTTAQSSNSSNYRVDQTFFGTGGTDQNACSGSYCAKQTAGELGVGNTCANNYCALAGFNTDDEPFIEFVVTGNNIDLGYLDTNEVKTAEGTFSVRAWKAGGYVVRTEAEPPTNTGPQQQQLAPMTTPGASTPGTEQFGINLVRNDDFPTVGQDLGEDPDQIPDGTFSFGEVDNAYDDPSIFKYTKGDRVAYSDFSTSVTAYTISYIFNITETTPSGQYNFNHVLVATGTY
jgi:hypothetical protein